MQTDELTLFRDMARRAFDAEITPYYDQWEHEKMVPDRKSTRLNSSH